MRRKLMWMPLMAAMIAGGVVYVGQVQATPASGFRGSTLAVGRFGNIEAANYEIQVPADRRHHKNLWLSIQKSKGESDLYVQDNVWDPGGTTGWHTHPGHSLIIVTAGAVTTYEGDDPKCRPHVYTQGMGFVDEGGDHVHIIRNEGSVEAKTVAVQLIPAGATRRVDAAANPACSF